MEVMSVKQARKIDRDTIEKIGVPGIVLMENAAQDIFNGIVHKGNDFLFFCGVGNNGGDGLAIARKLFLSDKGVKIYIIGSLEKASKEFLTNYYILKNMGVYIEVIGEEITSEICLNIKKADAVLDCIMGIGLNREITGIMYNLIQEINKYAKYIISVDNPTGLNADNGQVMGVSIKANETFVIEVFKKGYFNLRAKEYLGETHIVKIGIPENIKNNSSDNVKLLAREDYENMIPRRGIYGHKGSYGRTLILSGSNGMTGAAYITTESAVRTGAGLVSLVVEKDIQPILASKLIEAMTVNYDEKEKIDKLINEADVIICGPGLSKNKANKEMLYRFVNNSKCPMVLDADALNIVSEDDKILNKLKGRAVFTPHLGEMARLTNKTIKEIESNRIDVCREYASHDIITLLKGYNTIISNGVEVVVNDTGNSKMASGGMGDCLTGIIGGLISQGMDLFYGTILGAYIHGAIGDELAKNRYVVTARDIIEEIPKFMQDILNK